MSGWHPNIADGGLAPNPSDPGNPSQAFLPVTPPNFASPTYYGNGCDVRLRPHVLNSLISENLAVLDRVGLAYDPAKLTNTRTAIEYIVQRGLPKWVVLNGGPFFYNGVLDPVCQQYNNGMVLTVLPTVTNQGFVRIDVGGGSAPVLRNDLQELQAGDWPANVPQLVGHYNGAFYMLGICLSQVPVVLKGTIGFWIRTDGNDSTGDGTANTPDKAFRTIDGAWYAVGSRYSASPTSHIAFRLGNPGTYEAGILGPYGAAISLTGDPNNRTAYRINTPHNQPYNACALYLNGVNQFSLSGVTLVLTNSAPKPSGTQLLACANSVCTLNRCQFEVSVDNPDQGIIIWANSKSSVHPGYSSAMQVDNRIVGNGRTINMGIRLSASSSYIGTAPDMPQPPIWSWDSLHFALSGLFAEEGSTYAQGTDLVNVATTVTGPKYAARRNSSITMWNRPAPGNQDGWLQTYSSFTPGPP